MARIADDPAVLAGIFAVPFDLTVEIRDRERRGEVHAAVAFDPCDDVVGRGVHDFLVVGTGAGGGGTLACRLAEAGFSVIGLDAGPWFRPLEDFASDEAEQTNLYWTDDRIPTGGNPVQLGSNNSGNAVGGSTVHFAMVSLRFRPEWFRSRSLLGYGADWPVDIARMNSMLPRWRWLKAARRWASPGRRRRLPRCRRRTPVRLSRLLLHEPGAVAAALGQYADRFARALMSAMPDYNHQVGLKIVGEMLPQERNRVTLADDKDQ